MVILVAEQHIESGQATVYAGDVLLHFHFFFVVQYMVRIDLLLEHAQAVARRLLL